MLSQLKNMVASAVTQDPIYEYTVDDKSMTLCGRQELFRVKSAVEISTGREVSIFQIKIADLMARQEAAADITFLLERLRQGVATMSQLRHPGVLRVERGLVEVPNKKVWFVTERVRAWVPHLPLKEIPTQLRVLGLRRCAETLRFIHETADMLLVDFSPQSIFVASDGRWKVGDFFHAIRRADLLAEGERVVRLVCPPSRSWHAAAAPLLDYVAAEFLDHAAGGGRPPPPSQATRGGPALSDLLAGVGGATGSLGGTGSNGRSSHDGPLVFPESDVYSFLLTTVEVLNGGAKLFNCRSSLETARSQRAGVAREVDKFFPPNALCQRPRPPMSTVMATGPFATADMRMLDSLERYDTLDSGEKFELLKSLYHSISPETKASSSIGGWGGVNDVSFANFTLAGRAQTVGGASAQEGLFCEPVIVENILPLMKRESKQMAILRYIVPIMLQCGRVLSPPVFSKELREYFTTLLSAIVKATPPWFDKVGVLTHLVLENFDVLQMHFQSPSDRAQVLMPLLVKSLECEEDGAGTGSGQVEALLRTTLHAMRNLFESAGDAGVGALLPARDGAALLAGRLADVGVAHHGLYTPAFACLTRVLACASISAKEAVEAHLIAALRRSGSAGTATTGSGIASAGDSQTSEARELQLQSTIRIIESLEESFTREHVATKSLPLLAPLLLNPSNTVRTFALQSMDRHLALFRTGLAPVAQPLARTPSASESRTASTDFFAPPPTRPTPSASLTNSGALGLVSGPGVGGPPPLSRPLPISLFSSTTAPGPPPAPAAASLAPPLPAWSRPSPHHGGGGGANGGGYVPPSVPLMAPSPVGQGSGGPTPAAKVGYGSGASARCGSGGGAQGLSDDILSSLGFD